MSPTLPALILDTVLSRLAPLFLISAGGDLVAARHAAWQMVAAYHPQTPDELTLAMEIIHFSFHAMEALSQAAEPDLPLTRILRLRGSAVSLSRESHKSQRKLDQLRKARRTAEPAPMLVEPAPEPVPVPAAVVQTTPAKPLPPFNTRSHQQQQAAQRITETLKRNQILHSAQSQPTAPAG